MEENTSIRIRPLSLAEFGIIAVASRIWEHHIPTVKEQLLKQRRSKIRLDERFYSTTIKMQISERVTTKINLLPVPEATKLKIEMKLYELVDLSCDWILFATDNLNLDIRYIDKICWNSKGNIDTDKIFMSSWVDLPTDAYPQKIWFYKTFSPLHYLACFFAQEDIVRDFETEIVKEIKYIFPWLEIGKNSISRIMSIVIFCYRQTKYGLDFTEIGENEVNEANLSVGKILNFCKSCGLNRAFLYFYNQLDAIEEQNYLDKVSKSVFLDHSLIISEKDLSYREENFFQIILFLLTKMNSSQRDTLTLYNFHFIFLKCLTRESFQKFCIPLLDKFLLREYKEGNPRHYYATFEYQRYECLLCYLITILHRNVINLNLDHRFHVDVIEFLMKKIPKNIKIKLLAERRIVLSKMYNLFFVPVVKVIINDEDMLEYKIKMINRGENKFKTLIEEKKYSVLDQFRTEVLISKSEQNEFDNIFSNHILRLWTSHCQFDFVDNYLEWKYADQSNSFKINLYSTWCALVQKHYGHIKKLLMWLFGKKELPCLNNCEKHEVTLLKQICQELVYNIWFRSNIPFTRSHVAPAVGLSTEILKSVFLSETDITEFQKDVLVKDERCLKFFCSNALQRPYDIGSRKTEPSFEAIDEFLNFCSATEKIAEIKRIIANDSENWIMEYGANVNRLDIVIPLLDWVNGKTTENHEMLKKYFKNSDEVEDYYRVRS